MFISQKKLEKLIELTVNDHLDYLREKVNECLGETSDLWNSVYKLEEFLDIEKGYVKNKKK
jgi:hypothetical protein